MAKRQKISDKLQEKFNKPQFRIGDAVFFSWLGQKQYGHVLRIKQNSWGIQYTVESIEGLKYPCGIQIQNTKTDYSIGYLFYEDTRSLGNAEINKRINDIREAERISKNYRRPTITSAINNTDSRTSNADNNGSDTKTRKSRNGITDDVPSSSVRTNPDNPKKRKQVKNSELDDAIQRQKDFLNGFIKRD
jgi:hypothetical protein